MSINSKKKGNKWENKLANWLADNGFKAWKDGASGGGTREKGDIGNNLDMTIESKAYKQIKLMEWWRQVDKSASIHRNQPVLFIHQDGMPDNEWLVTMHSEDWIEMLKQARSSKQVSTNKSEDYKKKWAIDNALVALKKLKKIYE